VPVLTPRCIVGIDPSLTSTGIAIIHPGGDPEVTTKRVTSKGSKDATWYERGKRINDLAEQITDVLCRDSLVIIESPSYASVSTSSHDRSGLWWAIFEKATAWGSEVLPVTPAQRMTYAVGKGGGRGTDKDNILAAAIRRYPDVDITGNDIADAVILAAIGARLTGSPLEASLPAANLRALQKLELPTAA
jgi:crossover junction endodeoxyribonuclease RuvC